jgi:hypothetical protein
MPAFDELAPLDPVQADAGHRRLFTRRSLAQALVNDHDCLFALASNIDTREHRRAAGETGEPLG